MSALDTFLADAAKVARAIEPLVSFVSTAQVAVGLGGERAHQAIEMLDGALKALESYAAGHATAEQATAAMARLLDALVANNAAADAALDARFPGTVGA